LVDDSGNILLKAPARLHRPDVEATGRHDGRYGFYMDLSAIQSSKSAFIALVVEESTG